MGLLRLLLAICVILAHTTDRGYSGVGGWNAVQCFYIVSGFFMAMVLTEKYKEPSQLLTFYSNRALRLFSVYWLFLPLSIGSSALYYFTRHSGTFGRWIEVWPSLTAGDVAFLVFSTVFLIGHDWARFTLLGPHGMHFTTHLAVLDHTAETLYFDGQSWTLGLELTFYLIAPFIVRRRLWVVAAIAAATFVARYIAALHGFDKSSWMNGFFPFELGMFLIGVLSYRISAPFRKNFAGPLWTAFGLTSLILVLLFPLYEKNPGTFFTGGHLLLYSGIAVTTPVLLQTVGTRKWDRFIGELSYPVYLCHELFAQIFARVHFVKSTPGALSLLTILASCGLSMVVVRYLDIPVNHFREMRYRRSLQPKASSRQLGHRRAS